MPSIDVVAGQQWAVAVRGRRGQTHSAQAAVALTLTMAASTVAVPLFAVLSPFLVEDLGMTRTQLGIIVASTPAVGALSSPLVGRLTDRHSSRLMLYATAGGCVGVLSVIAAAPFYSLLLVATLGTGTLNALGNPVTNRFIVDRLPAGGRGWVTGTKQSGLQVGMLVAGATLPSIAQRAGWRVAVLCLMVVPLAAVVGTWSLPHTDAVRHPAVPRRERIHIEVPARRWLITYAFLMGAVNSVVLGFLPLYAQEDLGFTPVAGGIVAATVGAVAMFARISWGRLAERATRFSLPLAVIALLGVLGSVLVWVAPTVGGGALWAGGVLLASSLVAWNGAGMLAVISLVPPASVGTFSGQVQLGFFAGLAVSPVWFGALIDRTGSYAAGWSAIMTIASFALAVSLAWDRVERGRQTRISPPEIVSA